MQDKTEKLKELLKLVNEGLSRAEFTKAFEQVIKQVLEIEKKLASKIDAKTENASNELGQLKKDFNEIIRSAENTLANVRNESDSTFAGFRRRTYEAIASIFAKNEVNQKLSDALNKTTAKLKEIDERLENIKDGKDADEEKIVAEILSKIPQIPEIKPEEVRDKLELLKGEERLTIKAIEGLEERIEELKKNIGNRTTIFGGTPRTQMFVETPTGTINGSNAVFTINTTIYRPNGYFLFLNGAIQREGSSFEYTLAGKTITYNTAPPTGSQHYIMIIK